MTRALSPALLRALDTLFDDQPGPYTIDLPSGRTIFLMDKPEYDALLADSIRLRAQEEDPTHTSADDVLSMLDKD